MKTKFIALFILLLVIFAGCSTKSQERLENEDKVRKLAENMGVSDSDIEQRLNNMTDEELENAAMLVNDEGKIDPSKVMANVGEEVKKENDELIKDATLNEISIDCEDQESSTHLKEGAKISLNAIGVTESGEEVAMNNLEGNIVIKVYDVKYEAEEGSYYKEFKKGTLINTIEGDIEKWEITMDSE